MQNWIKCSERMPENEGFVLVVLHGATSYYTWSFEKDEWVTDHYSVPLSAITHWQPLPEPPND